MVYGALYGLCAGVTHSVQYGLTALLKEVNDGNYKFIDNVKVYGERAKAMKAFFIANGFEITYDMDLDEPIADGFYFTISYPGMKSGELLESLLYYGISAISLEITGSRRNDGLRACVSHVTKEQYAELELRLKCFHQDHPISKN